VRYNSAWDGQPGYWCQWVPCPHGCCLTWDGNEKFYAGLAWLQYLIDHVLRRGVWAQGSGDDQVADFSFDHRMNGRIVGEQQDLPELILLEVRDDVVERHLLRPGDPDYGQPGYRGIDDRPWIAGERPPSRSSLDDDLWSDIMATKPRVRRKRGTA